MAIPQAFIDDLIARVDIGEFIEHMGVKLKKSGNTSKASCPFPDHDDKTPSFNVIHDKNFCYCHGCGGGGDVIKFAEKHSGVTFPEAVEMVANFAGVTVPKEEKSTSNRDEALGSALNKAASVYRNNLASNANPTMNTMLKDRKISVESVQKFGLGTAKADWNQIKNMLGGTERKKLLADSGLCIYQEAENGEKEKFYDRFRNGIVFPIRDFKGQVVTFAIRHPEGRSPKYLNGPDTTLFKKSQTLYGLYEAQQIERRPKSLIVSEGYFDVIKSSQYGFNNAVAPMGTSLTETHIQKLIRSTNEVIFAFDGDKAGKKAATRALFTLLPYVDDHHTFKFMFLPDGQDPDSFLDQFGAQAYQKLLDNAEPFSKYIFTTLFEGKNPQNREDVASLASEFSGILNQMPASHLKGDLAKRFEQLTGMPLEQSLSIKVLTKDMSPAQLMDLTNQVRSVVANTGNISPASVQVSISADHYQSESSLKRFVNQQSIISQSLPVDATVEQKVELLNKAMEQVVINSNLKVQDESGIPIIQILTDAFKDVENQPDSEKRLKMMCISQLRQVLANHDMASLVKLISTEMERINKLGNNIMREVPERSGPVRDSLRNFVQCVRENTKYLDALGRFAPNKAYAHSYNQAVIKMKSEIDSLAKSLPSQKAQQSQKISQPMM